MGDLNAAQMGFPQDKAMPSPPTIASTTTIAPTNCMFFLSGTINVATITPFVTGAHMLVVIPTSATPGSLVTTGNIKVAYTTLTQNVPALLFYNPAEAKYYPKV